jgi:hypothetical protein
MSTAAAENIGTRNVSGSRGHRGVRFGMKQTADSRQQTVHNHDRAAGSDLTRESTTTVVTGWNQLKGGIEPTV